MKIIFLLLVATHGCIHLLGFLKAFNLAVVKEFTVPVSKPSGMGWLFGFLGFFTLLLASIGDYYYWWLIGIIACVFSQLLIILFWKDARYGTVVNLLIIIVAFAGFNKWLF